MRWMESIFLATESKTIDIDIKGIYFLKIITDKGTDCKESYSGVIRV